MEDDRPEATTSGYNDLADIEQPAVEVTEIPDPQDSTAENPPRSSVSYGILPTIGRPISLSYLFQHPKRDEFGTWGTLVLAYQTLGVVYGDLGTSPLYVFSSFELESPDEGDILGIFSILFWTFTLIPLIKYICIVLRADDHGEGGTFALYSLLCQHCNVGQNAGRQYSRIASDAQLKFFSKQKAGKDCIHSKAREFLEKSRIAQRTLLIVVMIGTCMVMGDGALTPAISALLKARDHVPWIQFSGAFAEIWWSPDSFAAVLSAIQGIQSQYPKMTQGAVVAVSAAILLLVFLLQRFGTAKVSFLFSPVMIAWFLSIAAIGAFNIGKYYGGIFKALSPHYGFLFFQKHRKRGWEMLGAAILCITGAEATFADLGHFNRRSIQIAFSVMVYPCLIIAYAGEAAYLIKHPENLSAAFFKSIPHVVFWPMFIISTLAAIVASQALISATFSIIKQSMALGCFPPVKIVHTSASKEGQIYSPEVNYVLMILCLAIVIGFRGGSEIGNAFGVAVIWVMLITTCLVSLIMLVVWNTHILLVLPFFLVFGSVEAVYMTSVLNKVGEGGWVPFGIAAIFLMAMLSWNYGTQKKYQYEMARKMSVEDLCALVANVGLVRVPGVCFFCTDLIYGLPPIVQHYVKNVGSLHNILIILTIRTVPVKTVLSEERFVVGKLGPKGVYRCLARYGYMDAPTMEGSQFLNSVLESIKEHIKSKEAQPSSSRNLEAGSDSSGSKLVVQSSTVSGYEEVEEVESAKGKGAVFVVGNTTLRTSKKTGCFESFVIDRPYRLLQNNCRTRISTWNAPLENLLQVGMLYEI